MIRRDTIYTHADGSPIPGRPEALTHPTSIADKIANMRAWAAYADKIHDVANLAFSAVFKTAVKS